MLQRIHPAAAHHGQVALFHLPVAHRILHHGKRRTFLADDEQAGGLAIKAVRQLQEARLRALLAQQLDHAEAHPAAAMHGEPGRFIDHQQGFILEHHIELQAGGGGGAGCGHGGALGHAHRRYPHFIPGLQAIGLADAPAIDPHLAAAQDAIDVTARHTLAHGEQEIVDALPCRLAVNEDATHGRCRACLFGRIFA